MNTAMGSSAIVIAFVRAVVECAVRGEDIRQAAVPAEVPAGAPDPCGGVFVTIYKFDRLRGCIGSLDPSTPFWEALRGAASAAALHDPRFAPVGAGELLDLRFHVSVLALPQTWRGLDQLKLGRDGIIVQGRGRRGIFLPQVATDHGMDKETFLSRCCSEKAGLPADA
ncbi:MAG: AmmeMemoRadiSam system protein A, partial [Planctomycetes bacterium]|nr:AmmeMemoRadiSam system protein A [Planctomycetota bacterium]